MEEKQNGEESPNEKTSPDNPSDNIYQKSNNPPMEVPHHAHHGKKNWKSYIWEFLMLFLAVTLGFFVENQREHFIEKSGKRSLYSRSGRSIEIDKIYPDLSSKRI